MEIEKLNIRLDSPAQRKKRVAVYARVSIENEITDHSADNQIESCTEQIAANPDWELAGIYEDRGISGTKEARPAFQRMLSDCRAGKIDLILTKSFTRFARNTVVLLNTLRELKELGIEVWFDKDHIRSLSESGELLITLLAAFAQAESQSASENQRWRIQKKFEEGVPVNGNGLGYRLVEGKIVIVPEEAEIVRMIFTDYLNGLSLHKLSQKLNRFYPRELEQGLWSSSTVHYILTNEKYCGDLLLQKSYTVDYISKKKSVNRGERPMYYVRDNHEPIISRETFDAVQARLEDRAKLAPERTREKHLFTGLIICDICGRHFHRGVQPSGKHFWICNAHCAHGKNYCANTQVREDVLIKISAAVLNISEDDVSPESLTRIREIRAKPDSKLLYILKDGTTQEISWAKLAHDLRWPPERRQAMRERMKQYQATRKEQENNE